MKGPALYLLTGSALALTCSCAAAQSEPEVATAITAPACISSPDNPEIAAFRDRIRNWAEVGWNQPEVGPSFDFRRQLGKYYEWEDPNVILFDNADSKRRINRSAAAYGAIWDEMVPTLKSLSNEVKETDILLCGDLALVDVKFVSSFAMRDGTVNKAPTFSSMVWRKSPDGWRIIREHGTALKD